MDPQASSNLISLGSLVVAALAMVFNFLKGSRGDAMRQQRVDDKLDHISEGLADVKETLKGLGATQDDVLKLQEQMRAVHRRLDRLEKNCDLHHGMEGTD